MGAICKDAAGESQHAVVVASDRMVTWAQMTQFEHRVPKFHVLGPTIVGLAAGDALVGTRLIEDVRPIAATATSVADVAEALANQYAAIRISSAEADILRPRGLTMETFYHMHRSMMENIVGMLDNQLTNYDLGVEVLLAGLDGAGGHLHTIHNPAGRYLTHDVIGAAAVGSGSLHAVQSMIEFRHFGEEALIDTIFRVYAAKRRAEVAPGVGKETDMLFMDGQGLHHLDGKTLSQLADLYRDFVTAADTGLDAKLSALNIGSEEAK
jgi:20S proteasome alpha/beta subunit